MTKKKKKNGELRAREQATRTTETEKAISKEICGNNALYHSWVNYF